MIITFVKGNLLSYNSDCFFFYQYLRQICTMTFLIVYKDHCLMFAVCANCLKKYISCLVLDNMHLREADTLNSQLWVNSIYPFKNRNKNSVSQSVCIHPNWSHQTVSFTLFNRATICDIFNIVVLNTKAYLHCDDIILLHTYGIMKTYMSTALSILNPVSIACPIHNYP